MISKLSVWGPTRAEAIARMKRALSEYVVKGITTNLRYLMAICEHEDFVKGDYDTGFLPRAHQRLLGTEDEKLTETALMAAAVFAHQRAEKQANTLQANAPAAGGSGWRMQSRPRGWGRR
jgi:acetyl-CoA carboxylase biotin carboxylase subunit